LGEAALIHHRDECSKQIGWNVAHATGPARTI
jgi:hypothetical protein